MDDNCRLCLGKIGRRKASSVSEFDPILARIFAFWNTNEHDFPKLICVQCCSKVRDFHSFSEKVQNNQEHLRRKHRERNGVDTEVCTNRPASTSECDFPASPGSEVDGTISADNVLDSHGLSNSHVEAFSPEEEEHAECPIDSGITKPIQRTEREPADKERGQLHENDRIIQEFFKMRCELCPETPEQLFDRFFLLQMHYRKHHHSRGYVRCCGKQFFRRFRVMEHIAAHRGTIRCEMCNKSFNSKSYLLLHKARKHRKVDTVRPYGCDRCNREFETEKELKAHLPTHDTTECGLCGKTVQVRYIKKHVAEIHNGARRWHMCDLCGKYLSSSIVLERHIKQHMGIETIEKLECTFCGKQVNGKYNLKKHIRCMHLEAGQVFRCEVCKHESPNSIALENHKKRVHSGEEFACDLCDRRFKRKVYLKGHNAAFHTRDPLYACEYCSATFNWKANYYNHRKLKHPVQWRALKEQKDTGS